MTLKFEKTEAKGESISPENWNIPLMPNHEQIAELKNIESQIKN